MEKYKSNCEISILIACKIKGIQQKDMDEKQIQTILYYYDLARMPKRVLITIALDLGINKKDLLELIKEEG